MLQSKSKEDAKGVVIRSGILLETLNFFQVFCLDNFDLDKKNLINFDLNEQNKLESYIGNPILNDLLKVLNNFSTGELLKPNYKIQLPLFTTGNMFLFCEDLKSALNCYERYSSIADGDFISFDLLREASTGNRLYQIVFNKDIEESDKGYLLYTIIFKSTLNLVYGLKNPFESLQLPYRLKSDKQLLEDYFDCTVSKSNTLAFTISKKNLDIISPFANHALKDGLIKNIRSRIFKNDYDPFIYQLKQIIKSTLTSPLFGQDLVANEVGMSSRQLQRKLKKVGLSYKDILLDCRIDIYNKMTMENHNPHNKEIAYYLGFDKINSYYSFVNKIKAH